MDDRIVFKEETIGANTIALEQEPYWKTDLDEKIGVSVDGEIIIWAENREIAIKYYNIIKQNILNKRYVRKGLPNE